MYMSGIRTKKQAALRVRIRALWTAFGGVSTNRITCERPDRPICGLRD